MRLFHISSFKTCNLRVTLIDAFLHYNKSEFVSLNLMCISMLYFKPSVSALSTETNHEVIYKVDDFLLIFLNIQELGKTWEDIQNENEEEEVVRTDGSADEE